jgi:hypothetical protein
MDARNLTELRKANDDNKPNHADKSGGIAVDVLPTGGVLLGTLEIRILEQMPLRGNPAHSHFIPMLSRPPLRPRNLPQQPHTMKTTRRTRCGLEQAKAKEDRAWERTMTKKTEAWEKSVLAQDKAWERAMTKKAMAWEKSWKAKNQPRSNR